MHSEYNMQNMHFSKKCLRTSAFPGISNDCENFRFFTVRLKKISKYFQPCPNEPSANTFFLRKIVKLSDLSKTIFIRTRMKIPFFWWQIWLHVINLRDRIAKIEISDYSSTIYLSEQTYQNTPCWSKMSKQTYQNTPCWSKMIIKSTMI